MLIRTLMKITTTPICVTRYKLLPCTSSYLILKMHLWWLSGLVMTEPLRAQKSSSASRGLCSSRSAESSFQEVCCSGNSRLPSPFAQASLTVIIKLVSVLVLPSFLQILQDLLLLCSALLQISGLVPFCSVPSGQGPHDPLLKSQSWPCPLREGGHQCNCRQKPSLETLQELLFSSQAEAWLRERPAPSVKSALHSDSLQLL